MFWLRVLVVDDEPLARSGLSLRVRWIEGVEVVAECGSASEAIEAMAAYRPDAVFLDIEMPELDGFGMLDRIERDLLPAVVFVTAHRDRALDAFRSGAVDYLVKPFDDKTLRESVERVRSLVASIRGSDAVREGSHKRLPIRDRGRTLYVDPFDIRWVEASGDRVYVHVGAKAYRIRATMRRIEAQLPGKHFVRVHRSAIVAISQIGRLEPYSRGEHVVVLNDGTKIPLSRRHRAHVERALGAGVPG